MKLICWFFGHRWHPMFCPAMGALVKLHICDRCGYIEFTDS